MKTKALSLIGGITLLFISCSENVNYTSEFIEQTSGRYLYTPDEVLVVYYENNSLFLKWRGVEKLKPAIMDQNTFFVADMYKKLRFVQHPETNQSHLFFPQDPFLDRRGNRVFQMVFPPVFLDHLTRCRKPSSNGRLLLRRCRWRNGG